MLTKTVVIILLEFDLISQMCCKLQINFQRWKIWQIIFFSNNFLKVKPKDLVKVNVECSFMYLQTEVSS